MKYYTAQGGPAAGMQINLHLSDPQAMDGKTIFRVIAPGGDLGAASYLYDFQADAVVWDGKGTEEDLVCGVRLGAHFDAPVEKQWQLPIQPGNPLWDMFDR